MSSAAAAIGCVRGQLELGFDDQVTFGKHEELLTLKKYIGVSFLKQHNLIQDRSHKFTSNVNTTNMLLL